MAAKLVSKALDQAMYTGSSPKGQYWAFKHPNPDAPAETYRFTKRSGNGWTLLLAASRATKEVLSFYVEDQQDKDDILAAMRWFGITGQIVQQGEDTVLKLASGQEIVSAMYGGEKKKK